MNKEYLFCAVKLCFSLNEQCNRAFEFVRRVSFEVSSMALYCVPLALRVVRPPRDISLSTSSSVALPACPSAVVQHISTHSTHACNTKSRNPGAHFFAILPLMKTCILYYKYIYIYVYIYIYIYISAYTYTYICIYI